MMNPEVCPVYKVTTEEGGGLTVSADKISVGKQRLPGQPLGWPAHDNVLITPNNPVEGGM